MFLEADKYSPFAIEKVAVYEVCFLALLISFVALISFFNRLIPLLQNFQDFDSDDSITIASQDDRYTVLSVVSKDINIQPNELLTSQEQLIYEEAPKTTSERPNSQGSHESSNLNDSTRKMLTTLRMSLVALSR